MKADNRNLLRDLSVQHPPSAFESCGEFFQNLYNCAKDALGTYSYRQLAVDLGFTATNIIHLIIQGKRNVSEKASLAIAEILQLKRDQKRYFLALAQLTRDKAPEDVNQTFRKALEIRSDMISSKLEKEQHSYYAKWYHSIIREMLSLPDFVHDPHWIAEKVFPSISVKEAEESLALLERLELIRFDADAGRWLQTNQTLSTGAEILSLSVQTYHQESIPQGVAAMVNFAAENRHISALVLSLSESQFQRVKQEIEFFQQRILELEKQRGDEAPDRVVRLNMQLFPSYLP